MDYVRDFGNPYTEKIRFLMLEDGDNGAVIDLCEKRLQPNADAFEQGCLAAFESIRAYNLQKAVKQM